jgi:hypothetical protein
MTLVSSVGEGVDADAAKNGKVIDVRAIIAGGESEQSAHVSLEVEDWGVNHRDAGAGSIRPSIKAGLTPFWR